MGRWHVMRLAQVIAWAAIAVIAYFTLAHVGLIYSIYFKLSPLLLNIGIRKYAAVEHFVAFAVLGALFCCAYPKRVWMICFIVFGSAIALELFQTMTPDRHGTDALQKISGGAFEISAAKAILNSRHQRRPTQKNAEVRARRDSGTLRPCSS